MVTAQPSAYVVLSGAVALMLAGLTLILSSAYLQNRELGRRVGLVEARPEVRAGHDLGRALRETYLLRGAAGELSNRDQRELVRQLSRFRIPAEYAYVVLVVARIISMGTLALGSFVLGSQLQIFAGRGPLLFLVAIGFAIGGWFLPPLLIGRLARAHSKIAAGGLADALELLVVCVEAGLALEDAIDRVALELRHSNSELAAEFAETSADLKILPDRDKALTNLAERLSVPSVRSFVVTLSQTLRFGTPLAQAMRVVASEMRNDALLEMEERANRLPTLLTIPMMLFIMPTIFLVVGGPAALRLLDTFLR